MAESGVAGYNEAGSDLWFGVVGPAGIPKPVVTKLNEKLNDYLTSVTLADVVSHQQGKQVHVIKDFRGREHGAEKAAEKVAA